MANVNRVILIGRLTRDPELRYTASGVPVAALGLAVNNFAKGADGQRREEPVFIDVTLWQREAELASEYLSKGRQVYLEGHLKMDTWDDKTTGQKRSKLVVVGDRMQFIDSRRDDPASPNEDAGYGAERPQAARKPAAAPPQRANGTHAAPLGKPNTLPADPSGGPDDDDIPF